MANKFEKNIYPNFSHINEKFENIDQRFEEIDKRFDRIEKDISFMKDDISFTSKRVDNIENILVSMQKTMENMNKSIILIEHTLTTKIPALFDGYSINQEKQEIQQESVDSLNKKVEEHDIRISSLEQAII